MTFDHVRAVRVCAPGLLAPHRSSDIRWWEPVLPPGAWICAERVAGRTVRRLIDRGRASPRRLAVALRLSGRLSRAAFNSRRFWSGKRA